MRRGTIVLLALIVGTVLVTGSLSAASGTRTAFSDPVRLGFEPGDDWEPDIAADGQGNVYVAWAHFGDVPGCDVCPSPAAMIQVSHNGGRTFGEPRPLNPGFVGYQIDLQVAVNAEGSAFVAYLQDKDTVVQRSDDFGETWSAPVPANVDIKESWTDKVGLAVLGERVYVSFSIAQRFYVSASEDGGRTFTTVQVNSRSKDTGWTLTSGGTVDSKGTVYFSWVGIHQSGNALGPQEVFLTKSSDRGHSWSFITLAEDLPPGPDCSEFECGWDFWGPQIVVSVDAADHVYVAYNAGMTDRGAPSVWFQASRDGGRTWTARTTVHADGASDAFHLFPAIEGGARNQVHVSWMDNRLGRFNVYYRTSSDGGATWSAEMILNADLGFPYQAANGFDFTYGDYYGLARDPRGGIHAAWGEGPDYIGPGNVFYATRS
jgi:Neuraminidase (sialidase)